MNGTIRRIGGCTLELVQGDIVDQDTEAIVNAANKWLAPGGGVAGTIHRAAGPGLWEECKRLGGCETGEAKLTSGHRLRAKHVIHTVGPLYSGGPRDPESSGPAGIYTQKEPKFPKFSLFLFDKRV